VNKTKESYGNDKNYVKHLSTSFAGLSLDKITPNRIAQYKSIRTAKGAKPQTVKHEMICLNHAFNLAIKEWEWATFNPMQRVKMPKVQNQIDRCLSYEEQDKVIEACYDREWLKDVIIFSLNTGMRQGEVINLKWLNVDLFRRTATVVKSKNGERRTVPLNQTVIDMLKAKSKVINLHGYIFTQDGEKVTKRVLQRQFATTLKRAGIKNFRWHDLRHSFATRLAQSGKVDIYAISKLLGHRDVRTTQRYAHHCPESVRFGVDILDSLNEQKQVTFSRFSHGEVAASS
jgi:site-specific recombinase XerD